MNKNLAEKTHKIITWIFAIIVFALIVLYLVCGFDWARKAIYFLVIPGLSLSLIRDRRKNPFH